MKKQSILYILIIAAFMLSACSNSSQSTFNNTDKITYKEAEQIEYKALNNTAAFLVFKLNSNSEEIGELYIKQFDSDIEKIAINVYKGQYTLLNNNDIIYIDSEYNLYLKKYGQDSTLIAKNVPFDWICASSKNAIFYRTYKSNDFVLGNDSQYKDVLLDTNGNTTVLFDSTVNNGASNNFYYFADNGELYIINSFNTLSKIDTEGNIKKLAGNVYSFDETPDGSAFAYSNYNNRLYIKWSGANEASAIEKYQVYDNYQLSNNGLSCIFVAEENDENNLMFVTPFNEPVNIAKYSNEYLANLSNDYLYILNEENKLYGYKLPKITAKTSSEDLQKELDEIKGILIGTDVNYYRISQNGNSVAYIDSNNQLFTSYELSEAVKIEDNINYVEYINNAIVYEDESSKLYVNEDYNNMNEVVSSSKEICEGIQAFYVEDNSLDFLIYLDENSNISTYSLREGSKLVLNNTKEYTLVSGNYINIYEKLLSIDDIKGLFSCENYSNSYDSFALKIEDDKIILVFEDSIITRNIIIADSTKSYISMTDENGYNYSFYKSEDEFTLEIYDDEIDSYYQYKITSIDDKEFNERLEQAQLSMKYNLVYNMIEDYYYNGYKATEALATYMEHNLDSDIVGQTDVNEEYYVNNYYVEDDYNFWLQIEYINQDGDNDLSWIYIDISKINIEN